MNEQDEKLRQLLATVIQHPAGSLRRRRAVERLLIAVQKFPEFNRYLYPSRTSYLSEAWNRTLEWLYQNINNFKPHSSSVREDLVRWINGYLYWRIRDLAKTESFSEGIFHFSLDVPMDFDDSQEQPTYLEQVAEQRQLLGTISKPTVLSGIDGYIEQIQRQSEEQLVLKLELYIKQDPKGELRSCYPRYHSECNCQELSQRLLFIFKNPPDRLADIAREFNINDQSLRWHWKQKALPLLQKILIELGYQPE